MFPVLIMKDLLVTRPTIDSYVQLGMSHFVACF